MGKGRQEIVLKPVSGFGSGTKFLLVRNEPLPVLLSQFLIGNIQSGTHRPHRVTGAALALKKCLGLDPHPTHGAVAVDHPMLDVVPSIADKIMSLPDRPGNHIAVLGMHSSDKPWERHSFIRVHIADGSHFRRPIDFFVDMIVIEYSKPCDTNALLQKFFGLEQLFFNALALCYINPRGEQQSTAFETPQRSYHEMPDPFRPVLRGNEPIAVIHCFISPEFVDELLNGLPDAVCPLPPVSQRRNVLDGVSGKPGPPPTHLQDAAVFVVDYEWNRGLGDRPIKEPGNFTEGTRPL